MPLNWELQSLEEYNTACGVLTEETMCADFFYTNTRKTKYLSPMCQTIYFLKADICSFTNLILAALDWGWCNLWSCRSHIVPSLHRKWHHHVTFRHRRKGAYPCSLQQFYFPPSTLPNWPHVDSNSWPPAYEASILPLCHERHAECEVHDLAQWSNVFLHEITLNIEILSLRKKLFILVIQINN